MSSLEMRDVDFGKHGVIYVTSDAARPEPKHSDWTIPACKVLLQLLPEQLKAFNLGKVQSKRRVFDNISEEMTKMGFPFTTAQCENKWKTFKRRYFTKYDKIRQGTPFKPSVRFRHDFEKEVERCLSIERPLFKREFTQRGRLSLNIPPGFSPKREPLSSESEQEFEYDLEAARAITDEDQQLVDMMLKENDADENQLCEGQPESDSNKYPEDEETQYEGLQQKTYELSRSGQIVQELELLRKTMKKNLEVTSEILSTQNATHEQILISLDAMDKREEEKLALERVKVERQSDLIAQMKIQNSLIAKLIQKISSCGSVNK